MTRIDFMLGGYDRGECLRTVELYDPLLNRWSQLPSMREARGRFDITVIDGKVYAVGGCNGTTELATAEVYSSDNSKWTALPPLELARSNVGKRGHLFLQYCRNICIKCN